ncbi:MAG: hypothetical protein CR972_01985 [Candidatus Moraniibacteriota bacterium]|nr:MAG: hypothetical protein CR972_01985 [Candidatus Moranbacteria bacterium]
MEKKKALSRGNFIFLFVVAFLCGAIGKKAMGDHVRMGYDDPTTVIMHGEFYDIDVLEQKLIQKGLPEEPIQEKDSQE